MTPASSARSAFEVEVRKLVPGAGAMDTQVVSARELAVPGFTTFEVMLGGSPVRGWAKDDGTAVIARMMRYGPILEALQFRDPLSSPSSREIAQRLAWAHGPGYTLAIDSLDLPPERDDLDDGRVELRCALTIDRIDDDNPAAVIQYRIRGHPDGHYDVKLHQLSR